MPRIVDHVIPPKLGFGLVVRKGQTLRITDLEGKQVVDMALFNADNPREKLSRPIHGPATSPSPAPNMSRGTSSRRVTP